jgi:hypothetical protein
MAHPCTLARAHTRDRSVFCGGYRASVRCETWRDLRACVESIASLGCAPCGLALEDILPAPVNADSAHSAQTRPNRAIVRPLQHPLRPAPPMCGEWGTHLPRRNRSRWSRQLHRKRGLHRRRRRRRRRDKHLQPPHPYRTRELPKGTAVAATLRMRCARGRRSGADRARRRLWMCWVSRCCAYGGRWAGRRARWQWALYIDGRVMLFALTARQTRSGLHCSTNSIRLAALAAEVEVAAHAASEPVLR